MFEFENIQMSKIREIERYRNAERLAKALKHYLTPSNDDISKPRGRIKDQRICQLNAAYKYVCFLEKNIEQLCEKTNNQIPENCHLLHDSVNSGQNGAPIDLMEAPSMRSKLEENGELYMGDIEPFTPTRITNQNIHESSSLSVSTAFASSAINPFRPIKHVRNFDDVDASPILGNQGHYMNENHEFTELNQRSNKRRLVEKSSNEINILPTESMQTDLNNNFLFNLEDQENKFLVKNSVNPRNKSTSNETIYKTPSNELEEDSNGRKSYFLRSTTTRLKYSLLTNMNESKLNKSNSKSNKNKKSQLQSSTASTPSSISSASTTTTTTPIICNTNTCETISNASSNDLDAVNAQNLIKLSLSSSQIAQIFEMNQEMQINQSSFDFV